MFSIHQSEAYVNLMQAVRARDQVRQFQIIEEQLAVTTAAEKAEWLILRAERTSSLMPAEQATVWAALEEALQLAPDDLVLKEQVLGAALGFSVGREQFDRFYPLLRRLGRNLRSLAASPYIIPPLSGLHIRRRTWARVYYWCTRLIDRHWALPKEEQVLRRGTLVYEYSHRCVSAACLHNLEQAEADLVVIRTMSAYYEPGYLDPLAFAVPEAEVALLKGATRDATMHLQQGMADNKRYQRMDDPVARVMCELLAARIARAEGNMVAFDHFCQQALAICRERDLRITESGVRRVMAGADK